MAVAKDIEQEIIDWYQEKYEDTEVTFHEAWADSFSEYLHEGVHLPSGEATLVEEFGGEGEGDSLWVVFSVGNRYFKVSGSYASWVGADWYGAHVIEVEPVQVQVTQYRTKGA